MMNVRVFKVEETKAPLYFVVTVADPTTYIACKGWCALTYRVVFDDPIQLAEYVCGQVAYDVIDNCYRLDDNAIIVSIEKVRTNNFLELL